MINRYRMVEMGEGFVESSKRGCECNQMGFTVGSEEERRKTLEA